ncbi:MULTISPECIES: hypothetical protein [unclassified Mesorhizobium]|uniref:hypothetical protein n=1 Tax=unclassified Mesorhizobium TaxID=325217 RepID=UPI000BB00795|nr:MULTISPECIES: hypothetical protein [unclassified Mesorhizobium]PBB83964.1 hypothetical protein CK216_25910 [Mesorhizobium sp. WSM3876]RWE20437.1 MAG: hypothetical protein EOS41_28680 [Mesorhizobium sp.]TGT57568.1 hypothetical protein EN813_036655 [Mesorhizobium sp. M00.F.Ca.ET.170.01.1.1]
MFYPGHVVMDDELAMLAGVHKTLCQERGIELDSLRGQRLAAHLFKMFLNGLTEQEELLHAARNRGPLVPPEQAFQQPLST